MHSDSSYCEHTLQVGQISAVTVVVVCLCRIVACSMFAAVLMNECFYVDPSHLHERPITAASNNVNSHRYDDIS